MGGALAQREVFPGAEREAFTGTGREGFPGAGRAGSGRDIFPSLVSRDLAQVEERYVAEFEDALVLLAGKVRRAARRAGGYDASDGSAGWWARQVRAGLSAFLRFFDDHPEYAGVLVAPPQIQAGLVLRCEQRLLGVLTGLLDDGAPCALGESMLEPHALSELVAGGVVAVVAARVRERHGERGEGSLVELAPALMAFIALPYLGLARAQEELARLGGDPGPRVPYRGLTTGLPIRVTHRTTVVLQAIASAPCASNRDVARLAEIADEGQASKLLARLAERGLIENLSRGVETGEPNAWRLTGEGERVLELIGALPLHPPRRRVKAAGEPAGAGAGEGAARGLDPMTFQPNDIE